MDVLVFMVVVFGSVFISNWHRTGSAKAAAHMMFDLGDDTNVLSK